MREMGERSMKRIERNKEGVPGWDGDAATYQEYAELAALWEQSVPYHKRYLCGPKLINELAGTARRFVLAQEPDWVSFQGGVPVLLDHLRKNLGLPQMSEMSDYMAKYFRYSKRKKNESMNEYISRKAELYTRAKYALSRVQQRYEPNHATSSNRSTTRFQDWSSGNGNRSQRGSVAPSEVGEMVAPREVPLQGEGDQLPHLDEWIVDQENDGGEPGSDPWAHYGNHSNWSWGNWQTHGWDWQDNQWHTWNSGNKVPIAASDGMWSSQGPELLPDFVQGWFLLQDSGLDTNERNMVMAALRNDFSSARVAQELRNQWNDEELRRHDQQHRGSAWVVHDDDGDEMDEADPPSDYAQLIQAGMTEDGLVAFEQAEDMAQEALVSIEKNRRTLKEAREKQHFVKMSRQFYRSSHRGNRPGQHPRRDDGPMKCLRCGGGHKSTQCPQRDKPQASHTDASESAPFVCYTDQISDESAYTTSAFITTHEAMRQGKAVLDGGATKTLASLTAMERIMELNAQKRGDHGVQQVFLDERPTFGFGNSSTDRCLSTAALNISAGGREGQLRVHTLDKGDGPLLFSIDALRKLGAIIDFEHDLAVFRSLDANRIIHLERSCTGHQLLPLTEDLFEKATETTQSVPSLATYL